MTSTIGPMLENCCNPCCGDGGCNNKWAINIESTNPHCLRVDTSECWVIKLEPSCPKPTYVGAWVNVTIKEVTPPDECYMDWGECGIKWGWEISATDEKVKACEGDTTADYLDKKIEAWHGITITKNWCDWSTNSSLIIDVDEDRLSIPFPPIEVHNNSKLVNLTVGGDDLHTLTITDKSSTTYDNMCCIGFTADQNFTVSIDNGGNSVEPLFMWERWKNWSIFTGNHDMATREWIKILEDGYYRLFWQITVQNNIYNDFYFNLWRWLLRINWERAALNQNMYLSTAKHWWYARQVLLKAWSWIDIDANWEISTWSWSGQTDDGFNWPWMTFNIDTLVDLREGDVVTIWYRPQSNLPESRWKQWSFRFVWQDDSSTNYNALFWGTLLWCYQLAPKLFQKNASNEVYENI